jgi:hypothetical protein
MLTVHHIDGHGRERLIPVTDVRYLPKGPGDKPSVQFDRADGASDATGFAFGRIEVINENGVTIRHFVLTDEQKPALTTGA